MIGKQERPFDPFGRYYLIMQIDGPDSECLLETFPSRAPLNFLVRLVRPDGRELDDAPILEQVEVQVGTVFTYKLHLKPHASLAGKTGYYYCDLLAHEANVDPPPVPHTPPRPEYRNPLMSVSSQVKILDADWVKTEMMDWLSTHLKATSSRYPIPNPPASKALHEQTVMLASSRYPIPNPPPPKMA